MAATETDVERRLRDTTDPNTGRHFLATKSVKKNHVDRHSLTVD